MSFSSNAHPRAEAIVAAARSWLGTRFHHQGRVKRNETHRGGVDCLGLLMGVAGELSLASCTGIALHELDESAYPHHPDGKFLQSMMRLHLREIAPHDAAAGDILLFNVRDITKHIGIISSSESQLNKETDIFFIHSYMPARAVVETRCSRQWRGQIESTFRFA